MSNDSDSDSDSSPLVAPPPLTMAMHSGNPINMAQIHAQQAVHNANLAFMAAMNATHLARMAQRSAKRAMNSVNALNSSRTRHKGGGSKTRRHNQNPRSRKHK
jgi:hypothetical protein